MTLFATPDERDKERGFVTLLTEQTPQTPRDLWRHRVEATPNAPFLYQDDAHLTFAEADARVRSVAGALQADGIKKGIRVLVGGANSNDLVLLHLAVREVGGVLVPLVPGLSGSELAYQVEHSQAAHMLADRTILDPLAAHAEVLDRCQVTDLTRDAARLWEHPQVDVSRLDPITDQDPWAIFYTSGSSGRPKGVVLPAGGFVSTGLGYVQRFNISAEDNYILPLTLGHAVGGITAQAIALTAGCRLTITDRFSPKGFWKTVRESRATVSILFPAQLNLLLEVSDGKHPVDTDPFRLVITHAVNGPFRRRFGVELGVCWGMTETGATSTGSLPHDPLLSADDYVGVPMEGVEIAVTDCSGNPLPPNTQGEIRLRHTHVMHEYLDDAEATQNTLINGWIRSGDRGEISPEGALYYRGRLKNMIKRSGENIAPEEVEAALSRVPGVLECLVFGVPDRIRTEEVAAIVIVDERVTDARALTTALAQDLTTWKVPRFVLLQRTTLPRLPNGKINRREAIGHAQMAQYWDRDAHA